VGNPLGIRASAEDAAKRLLPGSIEKDITPREMTSSTMKGYWLFSSNKESAEGEYRHLVTALMDVDRLQCVGTVLTNSGAPEVVDPCIAAFCTARRLVPAKK
jgi:hypothetical protein